MNLLKIKLLFPHKIRIGLTNLFEFFVFIYKIYFALQNFMPARLKRKKIRSLIKEKNPKTALETGTYLGDTSAFLSKIIDYVYTIEFDETLFDKARIRLNRLGNVEVLYGSSEKILETLFIEKKLSENMIFFLDAHYSGVNTSGSPKTIAPILKEMDLIIENLKVFTIVIDDAHRFGLDTSYPSWNDIFLRVHENSLNISFYLNIIIISNDEI